MGGKKRGGGNIAQGSLKEIITINCWPHQFWMDQFEQETYASHVAKRMNTYKLCTLYFAIPSESTVHASIFTVGINT